MEWTRREEEEEKEEKEEEEEEEEEATGRCYGALDGSVEDVLHGF